MRFSSDAWWLIGSAAAAIAIAPLLVRGDSQATARREQSRQRIEAMSPAERQRLEDNYERYRQLSEAEQARWRAFHEDLRRSPLAIKSLDAYTQWIQSLSPVSLDQLRQERDGERRVALIKQIEQQNEDEISVSGRGRGRMWSWNRTMFDNAAFFRAMQVLEREASGRLSSEQLELVGRLPADSPERALELLRQFRERGVTFQQIVSDQTLQDIIDRAELSRPLERVEERFRGRNVSRDDFRRQLVRQQLSSKLVELLFARSMSSPPSNEDLTARLSAADAASQERYYAMAADELKLTLRYEVFRERGDEMFRITSEFFETPFGGPRGGGPGSPGGGRPQGQGPDGDERGDTRRGGPQRRGDERGAPDAGRTDRPGPEGRDRRREGPGGPGDPPPDQGP
ncbi:MAG: hypothetical protein KF774_07255 [Planctomyces sp.]|nr:hypothetical protein [Planctomyces sp.]